MVGALRAATFVSRGSEPPAICLLSALARFRAALPGSETLTMLFEHVTGAETRVESFRRLCEFVGLRGEPTAPDFDAIKHEAARKIGRQCRFSRPTFLVQDRHDNTHILLYSDALYLCTYVLM